LRYLPGTNLEVGEIGYREVPDEKESDQTVFQAGQAREDPPGQGNVRKRKVFS
jgi:hypothetical protein